MEVRIFNIDNNILHTFNCSGVHVSPFFDLTGPVEVFWGFIAASVGSLVVAFCLAELCSAYPSVGGPYHWAAQVVPESAAPLASYVCGWFMFLGYVASEVKLLYCV